MLKDFLEFKMRVYSEKDIAEYSIEKDKAEEVAIDRGMKPEDVPPPLYSVGRIRFKPSEIIYYIETFSLEEKYISPDNPLMDNVTVCLKGSGEFTLDISYAKFEEALENHYKTKTKDK